MANTISFKLQNLGHGASSEKGGSQVGQVIAEASPSGLNVQPKHVIKDGYCVKIGPVTGDNGTAKLQDYSPEEVSNVEKFSFAVTPPPGPASASPEPPSAPLVAMAAGRTAITPTNISALCPPSVQSVTKAPLSPASAPPSAPLLRSLVPTSSKSIFASSIGSSIPIRADHTERRFSLQHIGQPGTESKSSSGTPDSLHRGSLSKSDISHTSERSRYRDHGVTTPYSRKNSTPYQNMALRSASNTRADQQEFKLKSIPVDKHFVFASNTETTCVDTVTASNVLVANILNIYHLQKVKNEFDVAISQTADISFTVSGKTGCVKQAANKLRSLEEQVKMDVVKLPCPLPSHFLPLFDEDLAVKLNKLQKDCSVQIEVVTRCGDLKNTDHFCRAMKETFSSREVALANTLSEYLTTPHAYMWYEVVQGAHTEHEMPENLIEALNLSYAPKSVVQVAYSGSELTVDFLNMTITLKKSCTNIKSVPSSWHRVDENFGLIELDKALSEAVEAFLLYGMPIVTEDKSYNVDLERMILTDKQSKDDTPIQRVPPAKCLYAPNMVIFLVSGLKEGASKASTRLQALVSELATKLELPLTGTEAIKNALFNKARQYCVKVSRHKERLVLESSPVYAEKVMFLVQSLYTELLTRSAAFPKHWEEMKGKVEVKSVPANSDEYKDVISLLQKTLRPSQVVRVERIQNQWLWDRYVFAKQRMAEKNGGEVNEKKLFHGTRKTLPEDVYASEHGFDFRFADKAMWGKGTYFAVNASYSNNYAHQDAKSKQKQLLLASVLTGDAFTSKPDGTLTKPPLKQLATDSMFKDERYDSVTGTTGGSQIYVVYDHDKAYPSYLITYK